MFHLLKIEWLKVKNYRTFWVLSCLFLVSLFGINYIAHYFEQKLFHAKNVGDVAKIMLGNTPYSFPNTWQMTSFLSSYLLLFPGFLMIISVTNEFSFKTHRQNIIDGLSRYEFINVKLMLGFIVALVSTFFVFLTAFYFGLLEGKTDISFDKSFNLIYFFLQAISYCWIAILFSVLFKRSGITIGVFVLYPLIEKIATFFISNYTDYFVKYFPLASTNKLLSAPVLEQVQKQIFTDDINITLQITSAIFYIAFYFFFIRWKFHTDDL